MAYLPLPDGSVVTIREGENPNQTWARAIKEYPEAFGYKKRDETPDQDKSGFKAAASAGVSQLQGGLGLLAGKLGLMDSGKAEAYNKAKEEEAAARHTPTKDSWIESPWLKLKETAGGSLPAMAATAGVGGAAALAAPFVGVGAGVAGMLGAGAASTAQFTASNMDRRMKETGESLDQTSGTRAFLTAIPQAALDVIALRAIPGLGKIFGAAGKEITEEGAKAMVAQTIKEKAKDYGWSTAKLMTKEGATEAAQAVLERAQAGLNIADADARNEYFENFMGGAALAGALGPGGRYVERGQQIAKGKQLEKDRLEKEQGAAKADALRQEAGASLERGQAPLAGPTRTPSLFGVEEDGNIRPPQDEAPEPPQSPEALAQQVRALTQLRTQLTDQKREAMAAAQTPADTLKIAEQFKAREEQLAAAEASAKEQAAQQAKEAETLQGDIKRLASLGKQWENAREARDDERMASLAAKMVPLEARTGWTTAQAQLKVQEDAASRRELPKIGSLTRGGVSEGSLVPETSGMGPGWDRQLPGVLMMPGPVQAPAQEERRAPAARPQPLADDESAQGDMFIPYSGTQAPKTVTPMPDAAQQSLLDEPKSRVRRNGMVPSVPTDQLSDSQDAQMRSRAQENKAREAWEEMRDPDNSRPWDALPIRIRNAWMFNVEQGTNTGELQERLAAVAQRAALPAETKKTPEAEPQRPGAAPNVLLKMANVAETRDLDPADRQVLDKLKDKMDILAKDKNAEADARDWLYHTLMVGPSAERRAAVQETLAALDRAGMSETERTRGRTASRELSEAETKLVRGQAPGVRQPAIEARSPTGAKIKTTPQQVEGFVDTAQQADMFADPDTQGAIYDSPEQFQEALNSETAQQRRAQRDRVSDDAPYPERQDSAAARERVLQERRDAARREEQAKLERQQSDGARRVEFETAPTILNARNAKLETIDANTDKMLDKLPDAVQEPRDPKEVARERRQQAKAAKAKKVDARTMPQSVTKKTKDDKPDVLPRNQYRGKITAYPAAGKTNAVQETTTRKLTSEEISAQIKALGEQRAVVRKNQQERIAASERDAKAARERADKKWAEVANLEADPKAKNKEARVAKLTAEAKALELKANKMVQARTSNQRIVNDKKEKALTAKIAELNARQEVIQRAKDRAEGKPSPVLEEEVAEIAQGQQKWMPDSEREGQTEDEARAATVKRQIGPDTRPVSSAPNKLRTGNSDANEGGVDKRIKQERGTKQANTGIRKKEMEASNEDAERFAAVAEAKAKAEAMTDEIGRLLRVAEEKNKAAEAKAEAKQQAVFDDEGNPHYGDARDYPYASDYDYAERRSTPLRPEVAAAVKAGDLTTALEELAKNASSPFLREAAAKLVPLLGKTKIKFSDRVEHNGAKVDAVYHHASNEIEMDPTLASEETLIHEAVHAATMAALRADPATLTPEQAKARKSLEALFARLQKDIEFADEYGIKNIAEFVSEVLSNPTMRDKLDTKVELERGLLRKLYDAVLKLLGIETKGSAAQVTDDIYKLFQPSSQLTSGETVASILRGVFQGNQPQYSANVDKETQEIVSRGIGRDATLGDRLAAINSGLAWRTAIADRWAPIEALIKRGVAAGLLTEVQALQLRLNMRNHEQAGAYIGAAATDGVPQLTKDEEGLGTYIMQGKAGANLKSIGKILAGAGVGNEAATEQLFSQWMAIKREETVGTDKLNYKSPLTPAERTRVMENVNRNKQTADAFEAARKEYKQYNTDLMKAMVDTGVITKELRDQLLKGDYMPFYRLKGNAVVMDLGTSTPVTIGNVVDQPYLKELVGGNDKILPFFSGAMQNTSLLMRTALRNLQAKDVSFMLQELGYAKIHKKDEKNGSMGPEGSIRFKVDGIDHWLQLDKDAFPHDIPPELVLQGMQGIKTAMPAFVQMMSGPSNMLRKAVTRMPLYAMRQMIRDPIHAWLTTGGDFKPVISSFKELAKVMRGQSETDMKLKRAGVISTNVMTGDEQDTARILRDVSAGKTPWNQAMAKLDEFAMAADATTRAVLYDSFRKQGMGHHEALLNTLESMNFSRRGSSASLHWLSTMIPFFNAQIQGADAVYRSLRGDTSFENKMDARNQLLKRGAMIAGMTATYALMMQDDEAYKNATPEERAMNWFVHTPFSDEPIRVPIPFELGLLFKALPEAAINTAFGDTTLKGAAAAIGKQLWMSTPLALPTAINPVVEVAANYSFFSDQPIESSRERTLTSDQRYRPGTTEAAKMLGALGVLSPVQIEHLVRGYTGSMGMTLMAVADLALRPLTGADEVAKADRKDSELPVLGPLFQPTTGRGAINEAFKDIERFQQAHQTYKKLMEEGNRAEAAAFASKFSREIALASTGGAFRQQMGEIATLKRNIAASRDMDGAQKRDQIERLKQVEIQLANRIKQLSTVD